MIERDVVFYPHSLKNSTLPRFRTIVAFLCLDLKDFFKEEQQQLSK